MKRFKTNFYTGLVAASALLLPVGVSADSTEPDSISSMLDNMTDEEFQAYQDSVLSVLYPPVRAVEIERPPSDDVSDDTGESPASAVPKENTHVPTIVDIGYGNVGQIELQSGFGQSGARTYTVPIKVGPGMANFAPEISLSYNNFSGNGALGMGWSLSGISSIDRTSRNIYYDGETAGITMTIDDALVLDGQRLIKTGGTGSYKTFESETGNIKVKGYFAGNVYKYFEVFHPDGRYGLYGWTNNTTSKLKYPIVVSRDLHGNEIQYSYKVSDSDQNYAIYKIQYNGNTIEFVYESRRDKLLSYLGGYAITENNLLSGIVCSSGGTTIHEYNFYYKVSNEVSLLEKIRYSSEKGSLNPLVFYYGTGAKGDSYTTTTTQLLQWYECEKPNLVRVQRGKFDYASGTEGIIMFPNLNPFWWIRRNGNLFNHSFNCYTNLYKGDETIFLYGRLEYQGATALSTLTTEKGFVDIMCVDLEGTQEEYVVKVNNNVVNDKDIVVFKVYKVLPYGGSSLLYTRSYEYMQIYTDNNGTKSVCPKYFYPGDFDGDGRMEIMAVSIDKPWEFDNIRSKCMIFNLPDGTVAYSGNMLNYNVTVLGTQTSDGYEAENGSDKLFTLDYNGDGRTDVCHINQNGLHVYSFSGVPGTFSPRKVATFSGINVGTLKNKSVLPCEFNGDGLTDFLVSSNRVEADIIWKVYNSKGDGQWAESSFRGQSSTRDENTGFITQDINGDGISDLIEYNKSKFNTFLTHRNTIVSAAVPNMPFDSSLDLLIPINRASRNTFTQLMTLRKGLLTKYAFSRDDNQESMLTGAVSSLGVIERNNYLSLTNASRQLGFYAKGSDAVFPYVNMNEPLTVLMSSEKFMSGQKIESNTYNYMNAVVHKQGRGFMGFGKIIVFDIDGNASTCEFDPYNFGIPKLSKNKKQETTFSFAVKVDANRIAHLNLTSKVDKDLAKGTSETTAYTYDAYGNPTEEKVTYRSGLTKTTAYKYYNNPVFAQGYYLGVLQEKTQTVARGSDTFVERYAVPKILRGLPVETNTYKNGNLERSEALTYDSHGNRLKEVIRNYNSTATHTTTCEYGDRGFLVKKTLPSGLTESYTYNQSGQVATFTDARGVKKEYTYNANGEVYSEKAPYLTIPYYNDYKWEAAGSYGVYSVTRRYPDAPSEQVVYDALGREVRTKTMNPEGKWVCVERAYNNNGKVRKESLPYMEGVSAAGWNFYTYDKYDRLLSVEYASGRESSISYTGNTVESMEDGVITTRVYDNDGVLLSSTDASGSVTFTVNAKGDPVTITAPGNVKTTITYDGYGRVKTKDDPGFGTLSYTYDNEGNVSEETNGNGEVTKYEYDTENRLKSAKYSDMTVTRTYNTYGDLISCKTDKGSEITYTYDSYGRVTEEKEAYGANWFKKTNTYSNNMLYSVSFESNRGSLGSLRYDTSNRHVSQISHNGTEILKIESTNNYKVPALVKTGPLERSYSYSTFGLPTERSVKNGSAYLYRASYDFDPADNCLRSRTDMLRNKKEAFTYDGLNRLTGWAGNTTAYDVKGNITSKSDVGEMKYTLGSKPYSVTSLTGNAEIEESENSMDYFSFGRPKNLMATGKTATFDYNGNLDRCYQQYSSSKVLQFRRTYLGGCYEVDMYRDGTAVERLYLGGDYYKASSVLVKEGSNSSIYYILRDYLGSITGVADSNGKLVEEYSYDAWGNRRDPATHELIDGNGYGRSKVGDRGYTGHEHISWMGLINMNARLYDPALGRFASPDPLVQNPDMPQNYNSYSYCVNNPLKYTDPDGEFFIFTFLNAVTELFGNLFQHGINFSQYDWKRTENALKIDVGMFKGNFLQVLNKWTYGFINSFFGNYLSQLYNFFGQVDDVTYLDGMAALSGATGGGAVTIGHYSLGPKNYQATWTDNLFVHEYGHYIQSQRMGSAYLLLVGKPSLFSAAFTSAWSGMEHKDRWFEVDASNKGAKYFDKHYGRGSKGYYEGSPNHFDIKTFRDSKHPSPYINLRLDSESQDRHFPNEKGKVVFWDFIL